MEEKGASKVPATRGPEGEESKNREKIDNKKWPGLTPNWQKPIKPQLKKKNPLDPNPIQNKYKDNDI